MTSQPIGRAVTPAMAKAGAKVIEDTHGGDLAWLSESTRENIATAIFEAMERVRRHGDG